jgi:hypothetical protein
LARNFLQASPSALPTGKLEEQRNQSSSDLEDFGDVLPVEMPELWTAAIKIKCIA